LAALKTKVTHLINSQLTPSLCEGWTPSDTWRQGESLMQRVIEALRPLFGAETPTLSKESDN